MLKKLLGLPILIAAAVVYVAPARAQQLKESYGEVMKNIQKCNPDAVHTLLTGSSAQVSSGAPMLDPATLVSPEGVPIVVAAAATDCVGAELELLNAGAAVTTADPQGNTALHMAAASSTQAMVQLLVDKHADVNAKNAKGETPLALAQTNNYKGKTEQRAKIIAYLTKKGAK